MDNHPHIRGEYHGRDCRCDGAGGSPPHTRGILGSGISSLSCSRITPAYAGNTPVPPLLPLPGKDHPRIRGEYYLSTDIRTHKRGSPPHTRGILFGGRNPAFFCGITPAYAGNTQMGIYLSRLCQDHPRIRGEYEKQRSYRQYQPGSPPHTRGILFCNTRI